jgi:hypothetical protein
MEGAVPAAEAEGDDVEQPDQEDLVARRLRAWRDAADLSGPDAAALFSEQMGSTIEWGRLRSLEKGEVPPGPDEAAALAGAYGRSVDDLTGPKTAEEQEADDRAAPPRLLEDDRPDELRQRSPYRPRTTAPITDGQLWDLQPGDTIRRTKLHERFGGSGRGGIAPSRKSPNVLVFSDPAIERKDAYLDQWDEAGTLFLYCGEGQTGDQELDKGNAAILNHRRDGRTLRVFQGCTGEVTYAGEFELAHRMPYTREFVPTGDDGSQRRVIVFRLVPLD